MWKPTKNANVCTPTGGLQSRWGSAAFPRGMCWGGFTVLELVISMAILATLAALAIPVFSRQIEKVRIARTMAEIRMLEKEIFAYRVEKNSYPMSLGDVGHGALADPWGNLYEYVNIADCQKGKGPKDKGKKAKKDKSTKDQCKNQANPRKDRFLVPVNSDYDLYSKGKDGESRTPFTPKVSRDDIIRCNDGGYVGLVSEY